jgi:hypothetical protein
MKKKRRENAASDHSQISLLDTPFSCQSRTPLCLFPSSPLPTVIEREMFSATEEEEEEEKVSPHSTATVLPHLCLIAEHF